MCTLTRPLMAACLHFVYVRVCVCGGGGEGFSFFSSVVSPPQDRAWTSQRSEFAVGDHLSRLCASSRLKLLILKVWDVSGTAAAVPGFLK